MVLAVLGMSDPMPTVTTLTCFPMLQIQGGGPFHATVLQASFKLHGQLLLGSARQRA